MNLVQKEAADAAKLQADLQKEANNLEKQRLAAQRDTARSAQIQLQIAQQAEERRILKEKQEEREKKPVKTGTSLLVLNRVGLRSTHRFAKLQQPLGFDGRKHQ